MNWILVCIYLSCSNDAWNLIGIQELSNRQSRLNGSRFAEYYLIEQLTRDQNEYYNFPRTYQEDYNEQWAPQRIWPRD